MRLKLGAKSASSKAAPNGLDKINSDLQGLGFTEYEARAYVALCQSYPASAYEVSKISGLPRANAYNVLKSLQKKGAVQPVTKKPARYAPHDPEAFFNQILKNTSELCSSLPRDIQAISRPDENVYVWTFNGQRDVHAKISEIIADAREHIWIKSPARLVEPHINSLKEAAERGVSVLLILFGKEIRRFHLHSNILVFPHEGHSARIIGRAGNVLTVTIDSEGMMIASHASKVHGSYSNNRSIIYVIESLILHEVYFAEIFSKVGPLLEKAFGPSLCKLRDKYKPQGFGHHFQGKGKD